jgi:uncharacterized repeat protein (TIGR01451 family)
VALFGCATKDETTVIQTPSTVASLNVNVNPASAEVVVTGPESFTQTFTGNRFLTDLEPGQYTAKATAPGFVGADSQINVVAGHTSSISLVLEATSMISEAPRAVYRDDQGNLIPLDSGSLQSGQFVFYAWLEDKAFGILPANLTSTNFGDPGKPLVVEQKESAPSFTQNLAGAWVGFKDATGVVRPVIGADVRWEIDQQYSERVNSMQFGTSDDNRIALAYGVFDDQADTRTNNARLVAERFPLIASEFPLYNQTGISTPFADGFTWVTLFSPDKKAAARIVAVATIDGEEIGKQILYKNFSPAPRLEITKTVDLAVVDLDVSNTVTWTVTVRNVGFGDAKNVNLSDSLASGDGANYSLSGTPGTPVGDDGFTYSFPLDSAATPAPPQTAQLLGNAQSFAVLAKETVTNTGSSVVTGNVGVSAGSAVTGFPPGLVLSGTIHNNDAVAQEAQTALTAAYVGLGAKACTTGPVGVTDLGNTTILPGVHCYSSEANLTGPLVLDAEGDPAAEFVFNIGSTLITAAGATVSLINGANPCNIYWHVGSSATLGTTTLFAGNILAQADITATTGASISGRALARTGTVTMDGNAINAPLSCVTAPVSTKTLTFTADVTEPGTYCNVAKIVSYDDDATNTITPVDLNGQACFTAIQSDLSIVKDFVADDNTTSLGKSLTVAANEHAKMRVRVINAGTGPATGVVVKDELTSGTPTTIPYQLISVSSGTVNDSNNGFDTTIGTLPVGATTTLLFTVAASADGTYCDTATVTGPDITDSACLTVATPNLTITKTDGPPHDPGDYNSVVPGDTYTSEIVVNNTGDATAKNVVISDELGLHEAGAVRAIYVSSSLDGASGTLANNVVTANTVDIPADESVTFTVVSRIPLGALRGNYCDTATVKSSNAVNKEATDCVTVPTFSALQTQLVDLNDPVKVGNNVTYFSTLFVEALSNEGVTNNELTYSFGLSSPTVLGIPGVFREVSTKVYLDSAPVRDPITGFVVSDTSSPTAVLQALNTDYTVDNTTGGLQLLNMSPSVVLQPNTALYVVHVVTVPSGTATGRLYTTSYIWDSVGTGGGIPAHTYQASSSEPTTVLP